MRSGEDVMKYIEETYFEAEKHPSMYSDSPDNLFNFFMSLEYIYAFLDDSYPRKKNWLDFCRSKEITWEGTYTSFLEEAIGNTEHLSLTVAQIYQALCDHWKEYLEWRVQLEKS